MCKQRLDKIYVARNNSALVAVADPGGQFGATAPPNNCCAPLKWRPSDKNATLFGAYRSRNKGRKYSV